MNNAETGLSSRKKRTDGRIKDLLIVCVLALCLLVASWMVFQDDEGENVQTAVLTENEQKVVRILEEIDGVGKASVAVCETDDGVESVVVVCEGANDLRVIMDVKEAVSAALGTKQNAVKIYLKKEERR